MAWREKKGRSDAGGAAWRRGRGAVKGGARPAACPVHGGTGSSAQEQGRAKASTCGPDSTVPGGGEFDSKSNFKRNQIIFKFIQTLTAAKRIFSSSENLTENMVLYILKR
jgi:hypothetical protein